MEEKNIQHYSVKEILESTMEYFNGDTLASEAWLNKYALKDMDGNIYEKNPEGMHRRLAAEFARIESNYPNPLSEDEIFQLLHRFKYIIPGGSPMAGIGNDFQVVSISNCFVIGNDIDSDSYGGILFLDQELVQLQKRRAGVGLDLSFVRPEGSRVKNSAISSTGVVPFMERYSNSTREVAQGGRRGALMETIHIKHPDAAHFIDAKMEEGKVTGANISVKIDDEFMQAAIDKKSYLQQFPIDSDSPKFQDNIEAVELWNKIIHNAWKSAEPGILFWDTLIKESIPDCYADLGFKTVSTNPCLTSDVWVMTENGPFQVINLINEQFNIWVDGELHSSSKKGFFKTGTNREIFEIKTKKGLSIKSTDNHKFKKVIKEERGSKKTVWCELKDLQEGDLLNLNNNRSVDWGGNGKFGEGWLIGSLLGDGTFDEETAILQYWGNTRGEMKKVAVNYINENLSGRADLGSGDSNNSSIRVKSVRLGELSKVYGISKDKIIREEKLSNSSSEFYKGFLSGWFDADGTVLNNIEKGLNVRLSSSVLQNLYIAQRILLSLGIVSTVYENRRDEGFKDMPDGKGGLKKYRVKAQHELVISKDNIEYFQSKVNFLDKEKKTKLETALSKLKRGPYKEKFMDEIESIRFIGIEDVYDCQIPEINEFDGNGLSVHNCGEIPLCPMDSCRLLAINLYSYVINPFTKDAKFDFELFAKHARIAQRLMDDLVDLELEKIVKILEKIDSDPEPEHIKLVEKYMWNRIAEKAANGRRTGLGITAEGDMLAALGITYGTDESISFSEKVHKMLKLEAYRASVEMAQERGSFKIYDSEREKNNPFILRIKEEDSELYDKIVKYGRRNIALLTIAPTGTSSLMTQTTSGIEPLFLPVYKRRRKINPQEKGARVDFTDKQGDSWQEYSVFHDKFEKWLSINGYNVEEVREYDDDKIQQLIEISPYHKATSNDVNWIKKVEMQGRIQKHVDHSISVTVNLPNDVDEDLVAEVYKTAWKSGCKGITVYRDGSRQGVLLTGKEEKNECNSEDIHAKKRPKVLQAEVVRFQNQYEQWIAVVGMLDGRPYEIFTGKNESLSLPTYVEVGEVVKRRLDDGSSIYDFRYKDKDGFNHLVEGLSRTFNAEYWNYAKLISATLRHRMPLESVVIMITKLNLSGETLNTWKNGITRVLRRFVPKKETGNVCSNCAANLVMIEGCEKCMSCGKHNGKCS